jgi:hypothetical protein
MLSAMPEKTLQNCTRLPLKSGSYPRPFLLLLVDFGSFQPDLRAQPYIDVPE